VKKLRSIFQLKIVETSQIRETVFFSAGNLFVGQHLVTRLSQLYNNNSNNIFTRATTTIIKTTTPVTTTPITTKFLHSNNNNNKKITTTSFQQQRELSIRQRTKKKYVSLAKLF